MAISSLSWKICTVFSVARSHRIWCTSRRGGVVAAAKLDVAVAVQLHLSPNSQFRRHVRQRAQDVLFRLGKQRQRLGLGCAVGAIPRIAHDPFQKLRVGVMEAAKGPCRQEVDFDGLHPRLDPALFLRFTRRAGRNQKAIRLGKGLIGALDLRIVVAGLGDGALGIVDDDPGRDTAEELECPAMTAKPGLDLLVGVRSPHTDAGSRPASSRRNGS